MGADPRNATTATTTAIPDGTKLEDFQARLWGVNPAERKAVQSIFQYAKNKRKDISTKLTLRAREQLLADIVQFATAKGFIDDLYRNCSWVLEEVDPDLFSRLIANPALTEQILDGFSKKSLEKQLTAKPISQAAGKSQEVQVTDTQPKAGSSQAASGNQGAHSLFYNAYTKNPYNFVLAHRVLLDECSVSAEKMGDTYQALKDKELQLTYQRRLVFLSSTQPQDRTPADKEEIAQIEKALATKELTTSEQILAQAKLAPTSSAELRKTTSARIIKGLQYFANHQSEDKAQAEAQKIFNEFFKPQSSSPDTVWQNIEYFIKLSSNPSKKDRKLVEAYLKLVTKEVIANMFAAADTPDKFALVFNYLTVHHAQALLGSKVLNMAADPDRETESFVGTAHSAVANIRKFFYADLHANHEDNWLTRPNTAANVSPERTFLLMRKNPDITGTIYEQHPEEFNCFIRTFHRIGNPFEFLRTCKEWITGLHLTHSIVSLCRDSKPRKTTNPFNKYLRENRSLLGKEISTLCKKPNITEEENDRVIAVLSGNDANGDNPVLGQLIAAKAITGATLLAWEQNTRSNPAMHDKVCMCIASNPKLFSDFDAVQQAAQKKAAQQPAVTRAPADTTALPTTEVLMSESPSPKPAEPSSPTSSTTSLPAVPSDPAAQSSTIKYDHPYLKAAQQIADAVAEIKSKKWIKREDSGREEYIKNFIENGIKNGNCDQAICKIIASNPRYWKYVENYCKPGVFEFATTAEKRRDKVASLSPFFAAGLDPNRATIAYHCAHINGLKAAPNFLVLLQSVVDDAQELDEKAAQLQTATVPAAEKQSDPSAAATSEAATAQQPKATPQINAQRVMQALDMDSALSCLKFSNLSASTQQAVYARLAELVNNKVCQLTSGQFYQLYAIATPGSSPILDPSAAATSAAAQALPAPQSSQALLASLLSYAMTHWDALAKSDSPLRAKLLEQILDKVETEEQLSSKFNSFAAAFIGGNAEDRSDTEGSLCRSFFAHEYVTAEKLLASVGTQTNEQQSTLFVPLLGKLAQYGSADKFSAVLTEIPYNILQANSASFEVSFNDNFINTLSLPALLHCFDPHQGTCFAQKAAASLIKAIVGKISAPDISPQDLSSVLNLATTMAQSPTATNKPFLSALIGFVLRRSDKLDATQFSTFVKLFIEAGDESHLPLQEFFKQVTTEQLLAATNTDAERASVQRASVLSKLAQHAPDQVGKFASILAAMPYRALTVHSDPISAALKKIGIANLPLQTLLNCFQGEKCFNAGLKADLVPTIIDKASTEIVSWNQFSKLFEIQEAVTDATRIFAQRWREIFELTKPENLPEQLAHTKVLLLENSDRGKMFRQNVTVATLEALKSSAEQPTPEQWKQIFSNLWQDNRPLLLTLLQQQKPEILELAQYFDFDAWASQDSATFGRLINQQMSLQTLLSLFDAQGQPIRALGAGVAQKTVVGVIATKISQTAPESLTLAELEKCSKMLAMNTETSPEALIGFYLQNWDAYNKTDSAPNMAFTTSLLQADDRIGQCFRQHLTSAFLQKLSSDQLAAAIPLLWRGQKELVLDYLAAFDFAKAPQAAAAVITALVSQTDYLEQVQNLTDLLRLFNETGQFCSVDEATKQKVVTRLTALLSSHLSDEGNTLTEQQVQHLFAVNNKAAATPAKAPSAKVIPAKKSLAAAAAPPSVTPDQLKGALKKAKPQAASSSSSQETTGIADKTISSLIFGWAAKSWDALKKLSPDLSAKIINEGVASKNPEITHLIEVNIAQFVALANEKARFAAQVEPAVYASLILAALKEEGKPQVTSLLKLVMQHGKHEALISLLRNQNIQFVQENATIFAPLLEGAGLEEFKKAANGQDLLKFFTPSGAVIQGCEALLNTPELLAKLILTGKFTISWPEAAKPEATAEAAASDTTSTKTQQPRSFAQPGKFVSTKANLTIEQVKMVISWLQTAQIEASELVVVSLLGVAANCRDDRKDELMQRLAEMLSQDSIPKIIGALQDSEEIPKEDQLRLLKAVDKPMEAFFAPSKGEPEKEKILNALVYLLNFSFQSTAGLRDDTQGARLSRVTRSAISNFFAEHPSFYDHLIQQLTPEQIQASLNGAPGSSFFVQDFFKQAIQDEKLSNDTVLKFVDSVQSSFAGIKFLPDVIDAIFSSYRYGLHLLLSLNAAALKKYSGKLHKMWWDKHSEQIIALIRSPGEEQDAKVLRKLLSLQLPELTQAIFVSPGGTLLCLRCLSPEELTPHRQYIEQLLPQVEKPPQPKAAPAAAAPAATSKAPTGDARPSLAEITSFKLRKAPTTSSSADISSSAKASQEDSAAAAITPEQRGQFMSSLNQELVIKLLQMNAPGITKQLCSDVRTLLLVLDCGDAGMAAVKSANADKSVDRLLMSKLPEDAAPALLGGFTTAHVDVLVKASVKIPRAMYEAEAGRRWLESALFGTDEKLRINAILACPEFFEAQGVTHTSTPDNIRGFSLQSFSKQQLKTLLTSTAGEQQNNLATVIRSRNPAIILELFDDANPEGVIQQWEVIFEPWLNNCLSDKRQLTTEQFTKLFQCKNPKVKTWLADVCGKRSDLVAAAFADDKIPIVAGDENREAFFLPYLKTLQGAAITAAVVKKCLGAQSGGMQDWLGTVYAQAPNVVADLLGSLTSEQVQANYNLFKPLLQAAAQGKTTIAPANLSKFFAANGTYSETAKDAKSDIVALFTAQPKMLATFVHHCKDMPGFLNGFFQQNAELLQALLPQIKDGVTIQAILDHGDENLWKIIFTNQELFNCIPGIAHGMPRLEDKHRTVILDCLANGSQAQDYILENGQIVRSCKDLITTWFSDSSKLASNRSIVCGCFKNSKIREKLFADLSSYQVNALAKIGDEKVTEVLFSLYLQNTQRLDSPYAQLFKPYYDDGQRLRDIADTNPVFASEIFMRCGVLANKDGSEAAKFKAANPDMSREFDAIFRATFITKRTPEYIIQMTSQWLKEAMQSLTKETTKAQGEEVLATLFHCFTEEQLQQAYLRLPSLPYACTQALSKFKPKFVDKCNRARPTEGATTTAASSTTPAPSSTATTLQFLSFGGQFGVNIYDALYSQDEKQWESLGNRLTSFPTDLQEEFKTLMDIMRENDDPSQTKAAQENLYKFLTNKYACYLLQPKQLVQAVEIISKIDTAKEPSAKVPWQSIKESLRYTQSKLFGEGQTIKGRSLQSALTTVETQCMGTQIVSEDSHTAPQAMITTPSS